MLWLSVLGRRTVVDSRFCVLRRTMRADGLASSVAPGAWRLAAADAESHSQKISKAARVARLLRPTSLVLFRPSEKAMRRPFGCTHTS